jgi:sec-independent protein translocase protein TatA
VASQIATGRQRDYRPTRTVLYNREAELKPAEDTVFEGLFQPTHLILVLAIALLVFGPKNLPQLGRGLGDAIRGFKESMREGDQHDSSPKQ